MLPRSLAMRSMRSSVRPYSTTPRLLISSKKPAATSAADLHDLPSSVKQAGKPSSSSSASSYAPSGNSTSAADISSRPSAPGPSGPEVDASVAAPGQAGASSGEQQENWTTSFAGMSEKPFGGKAAEVLGEDINAEDVEIKPGE
jgi:hypothetical protein